MRIIKERQLGGKPVKNIKVADDYKFICYWSGVENVKKNKKTMFLNRGLLISDM